MRVITENYAFSFVRLFYPVLCQACGTDLVKGETFLCLRCDMQMVPAGIISVRYNPVFSLYEASLPLLGAITGFYYHRGSIIQQLIYQIKYNGKRKMAIWLGQKLGAMIKVLEDAPAIDLIVPVPLHRNRLKKRGFNQCDLISSGIALEIKAPVRNDLLIRVEQTVSQTHETRVGRWENVMHSFKIVDRESLKGKTVLLIDDVVTTGSTMLACARSLIDQGQCEVCIAAIAVSGEL